ncbi:MAG: hypothetical protein HOG03_00250 [Desulfobacula sp.]|jgi:hypothetical protein|nr:hypothetical protein [Desulfobacula sp.]MBT3483819.1 hypothetical protein [Desulfobacula sp.]MBT3803007.1 hypothetical protein [Desulfobacula sp.]MBT4023480.1 hypothetical protein [Desulfobacula sp.]MBT4197055.1 hypothetical protein [Desulfobacula sp.]
MMKALKNSERKRLVNDRRQFTYTSHVPERRSGMDRRNVEANKFNIGMA